jgi:RHH-type rel operon transcriptional repressor/antitoxin RelB
MYLFFRIAMATSIRLDAETEGRLNFLSQNTGRSKAYYIREIIQKGLEDLEDYYLAAEVLEKARKGEEVFYSSTEIRKDLGLDH